MAGGSDHVRGVSLAALSAAAAGPGMSRAGAAPVRRLSASGPGLPQPVRRLSAGSPWGPHPAVLHLDIDAFFASVEQLRAPRLQGRPVIVGSGVVASASYEARAYGIRAGTPIREALRRCPGAVVLVGHAPTYQAFAEKIFSLAATLSPDVETFLDDALVDLSGTECLHGHLIRAAEALRTRVARETGLSISLGLGTNRMVARMVTRLSKPGGFSWLRPGGEADFVAGRPIEELPGIGPHRAGVLRELGLATIGELRAFSSAQLRDLFGEAGLLIAERARGRDTRAIHPRELPASIRRETSFDEPVTRRGDLEAMLHYLTERAAARARALGVEPRRLRVHLRWSDGRTAAAATALEAPGCVTAGLFGVARGLLVRLLDRRKGVHNVGIELGRFHLEPLAQLQLFGEASCRLGGEASDEGGPMRAGAIRRARQERMDHAVDAIRGRFGFRAVVRGPSVELIDRVPGDRHGFVLRTPCLTR